MQRINQVFSHCSNIFHILENVIFFFINSFKSIQFNSNYYFFFFKDSQLRLEVLFSGVKHDNTR